MKHGRIVAATQVGVVDVPPEDIATKGRLMPGNIFLVDFEAGRVIKDEEVRVHALDFGSIMGLCMTAAGNSGCALRTAA